MSVTILKTSSVVPPEVLLCDDLDEAQRLFVGIHEVMTGPGMTTTAESEHHRAYRSVYGAVWSFTIIEQAALSPWWKTVGVPA